jgi:hypothetical protein
MAKVRFATTIFTCTSPGTPTVLACEWVERGQLDAKSSNPNPVFCMCRLDRVVQAQPSPFFLPLVSFCNVVRVFAMSLILLLDSQCNTTVRAAVDQSLKRKDERGTIVKPQHYEWEAAKSRLFRNFLTDMSH